MSSGDHLEMNGIVLTSVRGVLQVKLDSGQTILTYLSGKMKKNKINVVPGDSVRVKVSPYDPSQGIIFYREK